MKFIGIILTLVFFTIAHAQEKKNDITLYGGFELSHFSEKIPGIEYRRALNENWKLKVGLLGKREFYSRNIIRSGRFDLSDTAQMHREQFLSYRINETIKLGVDFTKFKNFSLGAQFVIGKAEGSSFIEDRAFYTPDGSEHAVYSEELTEQYHPAEPSPVGIIEIGSRRKYIGHLTYLAYGLGLTGEAKWPIGNFFEVALQYNPEFLFLKKTNFTGPQYDKDSNFTTDFENKTQSQFSQFTNLMLRVKF